VSTHAVSGPLSRTSTSAKAPAPAPASSSTNLTRTEASALVSIRRWLVQASEQWLPRLAWSVQRTGRAGLSGVALLLASLVFLVSTHLPLAREVEQLRSQLQVARAQAVKTPVSASDSGTALLRSLPGRAQMPALLGILLHQADTAHLTIDTGKYETTAMKSGGVMTYQISFPVTGPYPQVRQFIDATLAALPAVAVTELSLTRKTIGDGAVEAQIRLTAFTQDRP
jgi:Tfp pilus assembly protein PilO